ncbi:NAD(+) synthase [Algivirga pacifica]|uniref:Glutamine-dependent NAD(+) synthetase n=1 Tax=Algivirga pacifica TaxID=1162670 RepID=A0ABP9D0C5_9BACT
MRLLKIGGAELNQTPMDWERNKQNILDSIAEARKQQISVLCLPELCITGYGCEDAFYAQGMQHTAVEVLHEILPHTKDMVVSVGLPLVYQNRIFNTAALLVNGKIAGFAAKRFLAGNGIHYEPRWFTPWTANVTGKVSFEDYAIEEQYRTQEYPIGDILFDIDGVRIGFEICEDAWVADRPGQKLYHYGADVILNPSASHFAFDKLETRKRFVLEGSRAFSVTYVYANLLGNEAGRAIYDGGVMVASAGKLEALSERFSFKNYKVTGAVVDLSVNKLEKFQSSSFSQVSQEGVEVIRVKDMDLPEAQFEQNHVSEAVWESSDYILEEEFCRAETLGLFDYMRKSYSRGFVVSLSGGADSSCIVSLIWLMVKRGVNELGLEGFKEKLGYFSQLKDVKSEEEIMRHMLVTAYQPTENSGEVTYNAAKQLANAIGALFHNLNVNEIFKGYVGIVEGALDRELTWEQDDLALQNIQARVRAPSVWMLANIRGALLLSTSNRSEAAVGYATMDGDTSGGLSPIAGIDKAFLRQWLVWLEKNGVQRQFTLPALKYVNEQQPTAELRPQESKQTDEADLMPYDLLDEIEGAAIRDKQMPLECYRLMKFKFPQYSPEQLKAWVIRFFRLWSRNQWKRERYAPSFHLDDKNLDPKTWCRFPILSGGFEREIKRLETYKG